MKTPTLHAPTNAPEMIMTRARIFALTALLAVSATPLSAQGAPVTVAPGSKVVVAGSSNVHDWSLQGSTLQASIELDAAYLTKPMTEIEKPIRAVSLTIPVKSLKSGKGKMDENTYKALNAEKYPQIRYVLTSYEVDKSLTTRDAFTAKTVGELTVAGTTVKVEMPLTAMRNESGAAVSMIGEGKLQMKMTDVGVKPPVALLGTLRTKNEIEITFRVVLDKSTIVAATNKTN
jgi:polyisoprenoid-binding protein YceI